MRNHMALGWFYSPSQILRYFLSRIPSLVPRRPMKNANPIPALRQLDRHQWLMFAVGFAGWTWDAFDFFSVSLTITEIAEEFNVENSDVSWGLTITLMLRSVGALIFGSLADRYGRKWPFIGNLGALVILEMCTGFTQNLKQFLAVRALFGISMGGLFGPAASTALEDIPYDARGFLSGLFEQGYGTGYLLGALFYRALVPTTSHGWRSLFWFGAGPPILIMIFRYFLPETTYFQVMKAEREAKHAAEKAHAESPTEDAPQRDSKPRRNGLRAFAAESWISVKANWVLLIYMVVLMAGFNSCSHGSQDFYPTFLKDQLETSDTEVTVISVVGQIGAITGGALMGHVSTILGRRLTMLIACIIGGSLTPAYVFSRPSNIYVLCAPVFFLQSMVGGVWGPIPIHLIELSPPALRTLTVGLTYQLGNLASSASATIQSTIGEEPEYRLPPEDGQPRFDYGTVIGIFLGAVWAYQAFFLLLGPEMSREERDEMAREAKAFEESRKVGANLEQIGERRAKGEGTEERKEVVDSDELPRVEESKV